MSLKNALLPDSVVDAACGNDHSLAVTSGGELYSWGNNGYGQLGHGDRSHRSSPTRVGSRTDWVRVFAGANHSIAQTSDGKFYGFGLNVSKQLGEGLSTTAQYVQTPELLLPESINLSGSQASDLQTIRGNINSLSTNVFCGPNCTIFITSSTVFCNALYLNASYKNNNIFLLGANPSFLNKVVQYTLPHGIGAIPDGTTDYSITNNGILLNRYNMLAMNGMVRLWSDQSWSGYNNYYKSSNNSVANLSYNAKLSERWSYTFVFTNHFATRDLSHGGEAFYANMADFMVGTNTSSGSSLTISRNLFTHEKSSDYTYAAQDASVSLDDHTVFAISSNNDLLASVAPRRFISYSNSYFDTYTNYNYLSNLGEAPSNQDTTPQYRISLIDDGGKSNPYYVSNNRPESSPLFNSSGGGMDGTGDLQPYGNVKCSTVFNGRDRIYVLDNNGILHSAGKDDNYLLGRDVSTSTPANELHPTAIRNVKRVVSGRHHSLFLQN